MSRMPSIDSSAALQSNWIPDTNPFRLPQPPSWFLKLLWDQDAGLVMLPSRQGRKYLLARRRERSQTMHRIAINEKVHRRVPQSDGDMLESRHCVLVDTITSITGNAGTGSWMASAPGILQSLRNRDMWAAGGADKYNDKLLADEALVADRERQRLLDDIDHRARDAWRSYQARTGRRNQHANNQAVTRTRAVHV